MLSAFIFGLVASSALMTGAVAGAYWTPQRVLASALAFASGVLMPDANREGGKWVAFASAADFLLSFLIAEM
jgi:hypothetical protein